ncbi:hypothetical protein GCM10009687_63200 [Asanoa iriomotensis]|uniref:ABC-type phosphate transport system substrate-binding protein n=1 Tax=Asanoa iriomotensis TaxID=234613 RepID=A0ABQ4C4E7_9ACTN|nr:hypothetical protein Air01nite_37340 [Asanoa iriomotensis]
MLPSPAHAAPRRVPINGAGSTWTANLIDKWRRELVQRQIYLNYNPTGSADGRQQFTMGTVDFAVTEVPYGLDGDPPPVRQFTYLPLAAGGLAFAYNLRADGRQITNLRLSGDVIFKIFTRSITRWDDPLIKADNPGIVLPAKNILSVVRQDSAGTTLQLTRWMSTRYPDEWNAYCGTPPCGATPLFPANGHVLQQGSLGVTGYVQQASADGAITYVENAYAIGARLPVAKVLNEAGYYVSPTANAVAVALSAAEVVDNPADPATLDRVFTNPDPRAYPLSGYSYLVAPTAIERGLDIDKGYTLAESASYAVCEGQQSADVLGYAPLPINLVRTAFDQIRRIPGAEVPADPIAGCANPTFAPDGTNTLLETAPQPAECDNRASGQQCAGSTIASGIDLTVSATQINPGDPLTLTASVRPFGVTGTVAFLRGPDATAVGSVEAIGGTLAQLTTHTLPPGSYELTARFDPTDPSLYASSVSLPVRITVGGTPGDGRQVEISAEVAPGAFSLAVASPTANLGGGVVGGSAAGPLPAATVVDLRGTNGGWDLTAQVEDFTNGVATIPGAQLGWTPSASKVSGSGAVLPGFPVVPGTVVGGLADGVTLCSAPPAGSAGTFVCGADLRLDVPDTAAPGDYAATLTLTLA